MSVSELLGTNKTNRARSEHHELRRHLLWAVSIKMVDVDPVRLDPQGEPSSRPISQGRVALYK